MATMTNPIELNELTNHFVVIHPLDDRAGREGRHRESRPHDDDSGRAHFAAQLCGHTSVLMMLLVLYHVLDLAGLFARHG